MAEETASNSFGFLTRKIGPFPVWLYGVIAVGAWYWYTHFGPGASATRGAVTETDQITTQPNFGGSQYKTNAEWEAAAINFLDGESVPPDESSNAVYKYLHSQTLTPQEQNDINLAIDGIGPPPNIPAPSPVETPTPVTTKPRPVPLPKGRGINTGTPVKPTPGKPKPITGNPPKPMPPPPNQAPRPTPGPRRPVKRG